MQNELRSDAVASGLRVLSVAQLLRSVRDTLERRFPLAWVRGDGHTPGALVTDASLTDPISDTCNTNHSPLILTGEFGG